jgi:DNA-binding NarL/FixJ family response regulator
VVANPAPGGAGSPQHAEPLRVLLIEDDDGDAFLVQELLAEAGADMVMERARSLADARRLIPGAACVLLDLGLPDARGLQALRWLLQHYPESATVVLTGLSDEHLGEQAVRAGAQDYLVKGEVSGATLQRVIRYAMERRYWDETQRQLHTARINARENARLEHGLLLRQAGPYADAPRPGLILLDVSKPVDFEHFIEAIRQIDDFFLALVKLPLLPA